MFVNVSFAADAKDFVAVCPKNTKVLFENETTRIILVKQARGEICGMSYHRAHVDYHIKGAEIKVLNVDGSTARTFKIPEGSSFPVTEDTFSYEVIGGQMELIVVEFK